MTGEKKRAKYHVVVFASDKRGHDHHIIKTKPELDAWLKENKVSAHGNREAYFEMPDGRMVLIIKGHLQPPMVTVSV